MVEFNANYGNFDLGSLYDSLSDSDNEYLATINLGDLLINSLENNIVKFEETSKLEIEVHELDNECVKNETESHYAPQQKRFKCLAEADIDSLETKHQSTATKKNTQWGIK
ncbi:hypothetical protein DPMN_166909 [Dreissena polymorpha]|uniref:Uncharacterized protein n=1 Tax=Dreissena polymorpha TaxID=45954 RepID=A0A9D4EZS3_DREPO|nr:hypothetical protein DPMN_166909 [Dreissena polymorpha]